MLNPPQTPRLRDPRTRAAAKQQQNQQSDIPLQNQFQPLTEMDLSEQTDQTKDQTVPKVTKVRIPPLVITGFTSHQQLCEFIKPHTTEKFTTRATGDATKVLLTSIEDYRKVTDALEQNSITYHTFSLGGDRRLRFVVRGLPLNTGTDYIVTELARQDYPVKHVTQLKHPITSSPMPLFAITLDCPPGSRDLADLTELCHCKVTCEAPTAKRGVIQCYRCQRFGHTSKFCHHPDRCVRCGGEHRNTTCEAPRDSPATCANCKGKHTSNYKKCPAFQRATEVLKAKQANKPIPPLHPKPPKKPPTSTPPPQQQTTPPPINEATKTDNESHNKNNQNSTTYANITKQNKNNSEEPHPWYETIKDLCDIIIASNEMNDDIKTIISLIPKFLSPLAGTNKAELRLKALRIIVTSSP